MKIIFLPHPQREYRRVEHRSGTSLSLRRSVLPLSFRAQCTNRQLCKYTSLEIDLYMGQPQSNITSSSIILPPRRRLSPLYADHLQPGLVASAH